MQSRRHTAVPAVAPSPNQAKRTSSLFSSTSPRTPRNSGTHNYSSFFLTSANRKSSDSWNSSNYGDDQDWEWKTEQTLLLARTLDALPSHLLTPFHGPVPPSNLLDKIARGVAQAKGSEEWPHSIRATRLKLMELARNRGKEAAKEDRRRKIIREEEEDDDYFGFGEVLQQTTNTTQRRPLHRQSSINQEIKNNDNLARLSHCLQRADRIIPNPALNVYTPPPNNTHRPNPLLASVSRTLNLSTPSSSTLSSSLSSTFDTSSRKPLRRSISNLTETSNSTAPSIDAPIKNQIRRSESFCAPSLSTMSGSMLGQRQAFKRAPSYGLVAGAYRQAAEAGATTNCPSSDEEEKERTQKAKKVRRTKPATPPTDVDTPMSSPPKAALPKRTNAVTTSNKPARKPRANLQRNPSIFGAELPKPMLPPSLPSVSEHSTLTLKSPADIVSPQPKATVPKKLRRMRATSFARDPARRISFGSLPAPAEENEEFEAGLAALGGGGLDSAFQLQ